MKRHLRLVALAGLLAILASCASTRLAEYEFFGESIQVTVRAAPNSRVDASYDLDIDLDDPVSTLLSIGTSVAKASQVAVVRERLAAAHEQMDIEGSIYDEVTLFYESVMGMEIADGPQRDGYALRIEVEEYGVEAGSWTSSISFELRGSAELYDTYSGERIWREGFYQNEPASPSFFGLPDGAGNVVSAAMLSELTEEQIAEGLDRLARDAAWELSRDFERDLYRARQRQQ